MDPDTHMDPDTMEVLELVRGAARNRLDPDAQLVELLPILVGEPTGATVSEVLERLVQNENSN